MIFCKRIIQELASSPYVVNELTIVFFVSNDFKRDELVFIKIIVATPLVLHLASPLLLPKACCQ